jgi:hypothetical protein
MTWLPEGPLKLFLDVLDELPVTFTADDLGSQGRMLADYFSLDEIAANHIFRDLLVTD